MHILTDILKNRWHSYVFGWLLLLFVLAGPGVARAADIQQMEQGKQLFLTGDYVAAQSIFEAAFDDDPAHPEVNFYLGRCAFEQGDFEVAYMAFERVLMVDPSAERVQLEQARTLYSLGNFEQARRVFNDVAQANPPILVQQKIIAYLALIEQRTRDHAIHGMVSVGITSDDNVRASPADERINTVLGDVILSGGSASEQSDLIHHASVGIMHDYFASQRSMWKSRGQLYNAWYKEEDDLDLQLISLASGPAWKLAHGTLSVSGQFDHLTLNNDRYLQMVGGELRFNTILTPHWNINVSARLADKNYFQDNGKDSTVVVGGADLNWSSAAGRLVLAVSGEEEDAREDRNSFQRFQLGGTFYGNLPLVPLALRYTLGYRFRESRYRDKEPLFDQRRLDRQHLLSASLSHSLWYSVDRYRQLTAQLNYSYFNANSTIELYEYDKNVVDVSLIFKF